MHEMGVRIIVGTDAGVGNTPHHQYVGALEYLVTLGFEPGGCAPCCSPLSRGGTRHR